MRKGFLGLGGLFGTWVFFWFSVKRGVSNLVICQSSEKKPLLKVSGFTVFIRAFGLRGGRSRGFWGVKAVKQMAVRGINGAVRGFMVVSRCCQGGSIITKARTKWVVDWSEVVVIVGTGVRCRFNLRFVGGDLV